MMEASPAQAGKPVALRGRRCLGWTLAVGAFAALYLWGVSSWFQPDRFHIQSYYVDQGIYITTARKWVDEGLLRNGVIYPAFVENERFRTYMPGHYLVLAASYALLGARTLTFLLPNLLAFVLTSMGIFLIGNRLYGPRRGLVAASLYVLLPANALYAMSAMAEGTFTAASLTAFGAFVFLPRRHRWCVPLLLALPFLFRETGALLVLPMLACLVHRSGGFRPGKALVVLAASVGVLGGLNAWQIADGKGKVPLSWVTTGRFNYDNAYPDPQPELTPLGWGQAFLKNAQRNLREHGEQISEWRDFRAQFADASAQERSEELGPNQLPTGFAGLLCFLLAIGACTYQGLRRWKVDPVPLGSALIGLCLLGMIYLLYDVKGQKAMRSLLFIWPLLALGLAGSVGANRRPFLSNRLRLLFGLPALGALLWWQMGAVRQAGWEFVRHDNIADSATAALEVLHEDDTTLLVAPFEMLMDYAVQNYPVQVAFSPYNDETLALLAQRWTIGTLVLGRDQVGQRLSHQALHGLSLKEFPRKLYSGDRVYVAFQRR